MRKLRNRQQESKMTVKRLSLVAIFIFILYGMLISRLYQLQISQHNQYQLQANRNKNREVNIAPFRADIIDRHGKQLATFATKFILNIDDELNEKNKASLTKIGIKISDNKRYEISQEQYAYLYNHDIKGISVNALPYRYYPLGHACAHLIGYTGHYSQSKQFLNTPLEGKSGIEKIYDTELFGKAGLQRQHKNAKGELFNIEVLQEPQRSPPLQLSIDAELQHHIHDLMFGVAGSAIVLNPQNGEILAAISSPSFDPNDIKKENYTKRLDLQHKPMFNRLSQALYSPGSIIKPFLAMGALDEGQITPELVIDDPGHFKLNNNSKVFHDHKRTGHGKVNLHRAIAVSCDTYFYHLASKIGIDRIVSYLEHYKFSQKTGIEMTYEVMGTLPTKSYREKHYKKWYQGQTIISGIGQGDITASPIQIARAVMLLANYGIDYPLTFIKNNTGSFEKIKINTEHRDIVVKAMIEVAKTGTARKIQNKPFPLAAKTSTVQIISLEDPSQYHTLKDQHKDHHMLVAFAPTTSANVVILVITEHQNEAIHIADKILDLCYQYGYISWNNENGPSPL